MNKPIKIRLHVISPIHIGCGDVYEPTSFLIDEKRKKLIEFDPVDFVKSLNSKEMEDFNRIASSDNLLLIFKAIKRFYKPSIKGREIDVTDFLVNHYKKILSMGTYDRKAVINQFTIEKTAFNLNSNSPYIPGSSLKGAIRTAYLGKLANDNEIKEFWKTPRLLDQRDLETTLLDLQKGKEKMSSDPFRMLKISDLLPAGDVLTKIVYAVNKKKKNSDKELLADKGEVYHIFEVIEPGAVFEGAINLEEPADSSNIKLPIRRDFLISLNKFYVPLLEEEIKICKRIDVKPPLINQINNRFKDRINKDAFIIRLGRHSGAEAVTIEGNRYIKIMQGRGKPPKYLDHATTIWLASDEPKPKNNSNLIPFGWAVIEVVS